MTSPVKAILQYGCVYTESRHRKLRLDYNGRLLIVNAGSNAIFLAFRRKSFSDSFLFTASGRFFFGSEERFLDGVLFGAMGCLGTTCGLFVGLVLIA